MVEPYAGIVEAEKTQQETTEPEGEARASSEARTSHEDSHRLSTSSRDSFDREQAATIAQGNDEPELNPKLVDKTEAAPLKSRKGTPRNTDSFLKDDSIETRKITLTPGILREDGSTKSASSESARNTSMESLTKVTSPPEQTAKKEVKKEKEKKEKKQGMLSGLFKSKRKDKKSKEEVVESDAEKPSNEFSRDSPRGSPAPSGRSSPSQQTGGPTQVSPGLTVDTRRSEAQGKQQSQRSKLTKPSPSAPSPSRSPAREDKPAQQQPATSQDEPRSTSQQQQTQDQQKSGEFIAELEGSEAAYEMAGAEDIASQTAQTQAPPPQQQKEGPLSPLTNMLKGSSDPKPTKAKRSKQRVELDDFDSPAEDESPNPFKEQEERARKLSGEDGGALDESPVEVSASHNAFMHGTDSIHIPMPGQFEEETPEGSDDDEQEARGKSREVGKDDDESARSSSPSLIERPSSSAEDAEEPPPPGLTRNASGEATSDDATPTGPRSPSAAEKTTTQPPTTSSSPPPARNLSVDSTSKNHTPTTSSSDPETEPDTFSPTALHTWLTSPDSTKEIHDMMLLIHDTSGVVPVGGDHAVMKGLWVQERESVGRMMGELDGLLGGFLERRGVGGGGKGIKA